MNKDEIKIDEIKRSLECCAAVGSETSCSDCSYCYRCRDLCKDALNIITEQEKEIERVKAENTQLTTRLGQVLLAVDTVKEMNAMCNIDDKIKQAVKAFAEKLKDYINDKVVEEFNDMAADVIYLTIDIDEFEDYVDELLKEYEE